MRSIIKKILNEDVKLDRLHTYFLKKWESQVKSGQKPKIDYIDTIRKGLGDFIIQIDDWYFDFVGGEENAYKLFIEELKDLVISSDDISNSNLGFVGSDIHIGDTFEVQIIKIYSDYSDYRFGDDICSYRFYILSANIDTHLGMLNLEQFDELDMTSYWEIIEYITDLVNQYLKYLQYDFGVNYMYFDGEDFRGY